MRTAQQTARLRAMQQALRARRDALRERLRRRSPKKRGPDKDRRRWWLLLVLVLVLWLLLRDCGCDETSAAPGGPVPELSGAGPGAPTVALPAPAPLTGQVRRRDRPAYDSEPPGPLPWIASFRLQVASRSPRLAACFVGVQRPGRLKWTASVEPTHGRVSDHSLEPTLLSDELTERQRTCVIGVLSDPPYRLEAGQGRSTPSRVSMVIEF